MLKKLLFSLVGVLMVGDVGAVSAGMLKAPKIEDVTLSLGDVTATSTKINASVDVNSSLPAGLSLGGVDVEVPVSVYNVRAANLDVPRLALPRGKSTLTASAALEQSTLPKWWPGFVGGKEVLAVGLQPRVKGSLLGIPLNAKLLAINTNVPLPIMAGLQSKERIYMVFDGASDTTLAQNPGVHFQGGSQKSTQPILTVRSRKLD